MIFFRGIIRDLEDQLSGRSPRRSPST